MSYGNWYKGFGLSISATLIFSAFLAWRLGSMAKKGLEGSENAGLEFRRLADPRGCTQLPVFWSAADDLGNSGHRSLGDGDGGGCPR